MNDLRSMALALDSQYAAESMLNYVMAGTTLAITYYKDPAHKLPFRVLATGTQAEIDALYAWLLAHHLGIYVIAGAPVMPTLPQGAQGRLFA